MNLKHITLSKRQLWTCTYKSYEEELNRITYDIDVKGITAFDLLSKMKIHPVTLEYWIIKKIVRETETKYHHDNVLPFYNRKDVCKAMTELTLSRYKTPRHGKRRF